MVEIRAVVVVGPLARPLLLVLGHSQVTHEAVVSSVLAEPDLVLLELANRIAAETVLAETALEDAFLAGELLQNCVGTGKARCTTPRSRVANASSTAPGSP